MKLFEILENGNLVFSTDLISEFKSELKRNAMYYASSNAFQFIYEGKNTAGKENTYCLDEFNHDLYMDEVEMDSIDLVTQDTIQDTENLEEVSESWFNDIENQETKKMISTSDENDCYNGFIGYGSKKNMTEYYY